MMCAECGDDGQACCGTGLLLSCDIGFACGDDDTCTPCGDANEPCCGTGFNQECNGALDCNNAGVCE
jgi:hypothetical protein